MQSRGWRRNRAALAGIDGLIPITVVGLVSAVDVRRQRHVSQAFDAAEEICRWRKSNASFAKTAARHDFRLQLNRIAKAQFFSDANFSAGTDQTLPFVRLFAHLASQQDLDTSAKKIARGRIVRADGMRALAAAMTVEPRRKDARVVQD